MTWLWAIKAVARGVLAALRTRLGQAVALVLAVLAALGLARQRWRSQGRSQAEQEAKDKELEAHDRINDADTGIGASDSERIKRLRDLEKHWNRY